MTEQPSFDLISEVLQEENAEEINDSLMNASVDISVIEPFHDIDVFLKRVYDYYLIKGIKNVYIKNIVEWFVFTMFCFLGFVIFSFIIPSSLKFLLFAVVCVCVCINFGFKWKDMMKMRQISIFYNYSLNIDNESIKNIEWDNVIERLSAFFSKTSTPHTKKSITERIYRKRNYFIGLLKNKIVEPKIYSQTLLWVLETFIDNTLFYKTWGKTSEISTIYFDKSLKENNINRLKTYLYIYSSLNILLFFPFSMCILLYYFYRYFFQIHINIPFSSKNIFNREWTPYARIYMTDPYAEEHTILYKLYKCGNHTHKYINLFPSYKLFILSRGLLIISGSILSMLLLSSFFSNEENIYTFIYVFSIIVGGLYSFIITKEELFFPLKKYEKCLQKIQKLTNISWVLPGECLSETPKNIKLSNKLNRLYEYKIINILKEIISLLYIPYFIGVECTSKIPDIYNFYIDNTYNDSLSGSIFRKNENA